MSREQLESKDEQSGLKGRIKGARISYDTKAPIAKPIERARFWVTIIVAGTYGICIIGILIIGGARLWSCCPDITGVLELGDLLQKLLLPVVTLVLGFYYGTKN